MNRAERRRRARRKAEKVEQWAKWKCPWLSQRERALRRETTMGSGRCRHLWGNAMAEARARANEREQRE